MPSANKHSCRVHWSKGNKSDQRQGLRINCCIFLSVWVLPLKKMYQYWQMVSAELKSCVYAGSCNKSFTYILRGNKNAFSLYIYQQPIRPKTKVEIFVPACCFWPHECLTLWMEFLQITSHSIFCPSKTAMEIIQAKHLQLTVYEAWKLQRTMMWKQMLNYYCPSTLRKIQISCKLQKQ